MNIIYDTMFDSNTIDRFEKIAIKHKNRFGVWGDGNLGYITALLLKEFYPEICIEPDASRGESGAMYTGIDYSELITVLLKETQNLRKRVATLETKGA